jgi:hypothetical protein
MVMPAVEPRETKPPAALASSPGCCTTTFCTSGSREEVISSTCLEALTAASTGPRSDWILFRIWRPVCGAPSIQPLTGPLR